MKPEQLKRLEELREHKLSGGILTESENRQLEYLEAQERLYFARTNKHQRRLNF